MQPNKSLGFLLSLEGKMAVTWGELMNAQQAQIQHFFLIFTIFPWDSDVHEGNRGASMGCEKSLQKRKDEHIAFAGLGKRMKSSLQQWMCETTSNKFKAFW